MTVREAGASARRSRHPGSWPGAPPYTFPLSTSGMTEPGAGRDPPIRLPLGAGWGGPVSRRVPLARRPRRRPAQVEGPGRVTHSDRADRGPTPGLTQFDRWPSRTRTNPTPTSSPHRRRCTRDMRRLGVTGDLELDGLQVSRVVQNPLYPSPRPWSRNLGLPTSPSPPVFPTEGMPGLLCLLPGACPQAWTNSRTSPRGAKLEFVSRLLRLRTRGGEGQPERDDPLGGRGGAAGRGCTRAPTRRAARSMGWRA